MLEIHNLTVISMDIFIRNHILRSLFIYFVAIDPEKVKVCYLSNFDYSDLNHIKHRTIDIVTIKTDETLLHNSGVGYLVVNVRVHDIVFYSISEQGYKNDYKRTV